MTLAERLAKSERPNRKAQLQIRIQSRLIDVLGPKLYDKALSDLELEKLVYARLHELINEEDVPLSLPERAALIADIGNGVLGLGPLEPLIRDPEISEIMVNGPDQIYIERAGKIRASEAVFANEDQLRHVIDKIVARVGRRVDESSPYVDARLPDGSRVNAILPPLSVDGPALTIRKFSVDPLKIDDLISLGTVTTPVAQFFEAAVRGKLNIIVSGGTGTGKTTTLNVLSSFIPGDERIITIEDAAELRLQQDHIVRLEARPPNIEGQGEVTIRDLVRNALRMRPDRIVVGEVRGGEALDMLQAMNTGHDGSISTVHANSPRDVLSRLETMALMSGMDLTVRAMREQMASGIDLVIHLARMKDGSRRITHVSEILGMEGDIITMHDVFTFDYKAGIDGSGRFLGSLKPTGIRPMCLEKLEDHGIKLSTAILELEVSP